MTTIEISFIVVFAVLSLYVYEKQRKKVRRKNTIVANHKKQKFISVINEILGTQRNETPSPLVLETVKNLHQKVLHLFVPVHEIAEDWRSHADTVNNDLPFKDDCDGFALTMCELLLQAGFDPKDILFFSCYTERGEGHAVAGVSIDGVEYVADNRYKTVHPLLELTSKRWLQVEAYVSLDDPSNWRNL